MTHLKPVSAVSVLYLDKTLGILSSPSSCLYALLSTLARSAPGDTPSPRACRRDGPRGVPSSNPGRPRRPPSRFRAPAPVSAPPTRSPRAAALDRDASPRALPRPRRGRGAAPAPDRPKAKVAVFVSGGGSNLRALRRHARRPRPRRGCAVVSNKPDRLVGGRPRHSHPRLLQEDRRRRTHPDLVHQLVDVHGAEYVCLAGYLRLSSGTLPSLRATHAQHPPALLPAFGGKGMHGHHVHEAVVASGARFSGPLYISSTKSSTRGRYWRSGSWVAAGGLAGGRRREGARAGRRVRARVGGARGRAGRVQGGRGAVHRGGGRVKRRIRGGDANRAVYEASRIDGSPVGVMER